MIPNLTVTELRALAVKHEACDAGLTTYDLLTEGRESLTLRDIIPLVADYPMFGWGCYRLLHDEFPEAWEVYDREAALIREAHRNRRIDLSNEHTLASQVLWDRYCLDYSRRAATIGDTKAFDTAEDSDIYKAYQAQIAALDDQTSDAYEAARFDCQTAILAALTALID